MYVVFALRVSGYAGRYSSVVGNAQLTASMIYGRCYALLQLGRSQTTSLVPAIGVLAGLSYVLSLFTNHPPRPTSSQVHLYLNQILDRTLELMNAMTSYFQGLSVMLGPSTGRSGLRDALSPLVKGFDLQANQLLNEIWMLHIPPNTEGPIVQFNQIQRLLQPQDEVIRTAQKILLAERGSRHEFTCEWFAKPFLEFVRGSDSALWIDGRIGCGKSVLCGWILESLQGAVDGQEYAVITSVIDPLLPSETSTASVIKMLLQQLVRQQYGSHKVYSALANLVGTLAAGTAPVQVEKELWECLQICVDGAVQPTMLVIDGLSEVEGGEAAAAALFQKLLSSVTVSPLVRLLVLSRPFPFSSSTPLRRRTVEAKDVHKDIRRVITDLVPSHSPTPGVEIARRIDHDADGNFFWSLLTLQHWAAQEFSPQIWRNLPKSLDATVTLLVSKINLSDQVTCLVLFSSIIASRPLRLVEVETVSRLDVKNNTLMPQAPDVTRAINQSSGSLLIVQDGLVLFRHALLRQALLESLQFETLSLSPEMHADMAIRSLLYLKLVLTQDSELSLEPTKESTLKTLLDAYPFLPYALRHWTEHFVASSMFTHPYTFNPTSDCRQVFPNTVNAAIIEASFWRQYLSHEAPRALTIAATMRTVIFGDHEATLQSTACLAESLRMTEDYRGAATNFAIASELGQQLLPRFHPFTATCMFKFLDVMNLADEKEDLLPRKASALRYLISMYEVQSGPSSDQALDFCYLLANHYDDMQQSSLSSEIYQKIHQLVIDRYGKNSPQAKLSQEKLVTVLHGKSDEEGHSYSDSVFDDIVQTYPVTDARRIKASIAKAEEYISQGDPFNAELIYISLWHGIAEVCHSQKTHENHEKLLQTGLAYARFLRESDRMSDAQTVLLGLWSQQEALEYQTETTTNFLEEVAMEMERSGLPDVALVILETVLASSIPRSSDPESDRQRALRKAISDITLDMMRDPQRPPGEGALKLSYTDASVVNTLIGKLVSSGRFDDVIAVGGLTLHRLWPSIMDDSSGRGHSASDEVDLELAKLAANLAQAYMRTNQIEKAGLIYQNLFQSVRSSDTVEDSSPAVEYAELAIKAFEQSGQVDRVIALHEGLVHQHSRHGEHRSIESRYALASLYAKEQRFEDAKQQYTKIAEHLKQPGFLDFTPERKTIIMKAALELANIKLAENHDNMECNRLYESLVDIQEGILPDEREYTGAIVEEAENRLTNIYEEGINRDFMNGKTVSRAARLQGKKYQKQKTHEGASQPATLSNLAVWISMLTREGASDFKAVAVRELQLAIDSVIESDVQPSALYNAAVVLATSFAANGFLDDGIDIVQRLTEQVIFQQGGIDQQARSNLVFLTAFEAHLTGSMVDFAEIHAKVLMESALWEHYKRLSQMGAESTTTLACGARLRSFLIDHASLDRATLIEDGLYQRFIDDYGAAFAKSLETAREFFNLLLEELSSDRVQTDNLPSLASAALNKRVGSLLEEGRYKSALDLSSPGFEFIRFVRSNNNSNLEHGLQLGLMLACIEVAPAPDPAVAAQMQDLTKDILHETLRDCRSQDFDFNAVNIDFVSQLASVLGMQQNYEDLEVRSNSVNPR